MRLARWIFAALLAAPALAQNGTQTTSGIVEAPAEVLWNCFTNAEGIVKTWGVAQARVDFRIGGTIETRYDADGKLGEPGTIVQTILSYEHGRMLAIR